MTLEMDPNPANAPREDTAAAARRRGRLAAEAFDRQLREVESRERQELLARQRQWSGLDPGPPVGGTASADTVRRLQAEVESLAAFRDAVVRSKAWQAIQMLRRLVGRAW